MSPALKSGLVGVLALGALLSDWVFAELYLRNDSAVHVVGALALNALVLAVAYLLLRRLSSERAATVAIRTLVLLAAALLVVTTVRLALGSPTMGGPLRIIAGLVIVGASIATALRASEALAARLMRAIGYASVAFIVAPAAWHAVAGRTTTWIEAPEAAPQATESKRGTLFLLLDELGFDAAAPIAAELRAAGLHIEMRPLRAAAINTTNVIPSMFGGQRFERAQPCGRSSICSGTSFVDFSRIRVERPDVDVTGLLHPYCDIQGLRSCFQLALPHPYGNAYRGLLAFYLRRVSPTLADALRPADPPDMVRKYLEQQRRFIDESRFWRDGGVLYAHLYLPHPPGLDGPTTLDADYAANIDAAAALVRGLASRLKEGFGDRYSVIVTSDHALRTTWCPSPLYPAAACALRPEFRGASVPMIVAAPGPVAEHRITSNLQMFSVLRAELQRQPATPVH